MNRALNFARVRLGDFLHRRQEKIYIRPEETYREITIKLWGKGITQRRRVLGANVRENKRDIARKGQFILSRIDARNGAMGIVPDELDGAIITNDFPVFEVDPSQIFPGYLEWLSRTASFIDEIRRVSEGTTNRVRMQERKFLSISINLPSLLEQRRIVNRIEKLVVLAVETQNLRKQIMKEIGSFIISVHMKLSGGRRVKLGDIFALEEKSFAVLPTQYYPQVGVLGFGGGLFPKLAIAGTDTTYKTFNQLYRGALVLSQVKGWEGAVAICPDELEGWFVSPEYRTFRCRPDEVLPEYLSLFVRTEFFWSKLSKATRGVGGRRERTRPEQFLKVEIPMPDLKKQKLGALIFEKLELIRVFHDQIEPLLNAFVPSILDRAFKSEL